MPVHSRVAKADHELIVRESQQQLTESPAQVRQQRFAGEGRQIGLYQPAGRESGFGGHRRVLPALFLARPLATSSLSRMT